MQTDFPFQPVYRPAPWPFQAVSIELPEYLAKLSPLPAPVTDGTITPRAHS